MNPWAFVCWIVDLCWFPFTLELWIVDLGDLVGLMPWSQYASPTANYRVIILRSVGQKGENIFLGLTVPQVEDIEWCATNEIYSPPPSAIIPGMSNFLRGYWLKAEGTIVMILDGKSIMAAMPQ
jgi:positive phototaxis protein PixI